MKDLKYTNEFLKNLEEIVAKNDLKTLQKIKETLEKITKNTAEKYTLQNQKTHTNEDIFQTPIEEKAKPSYIFWTKRVSKEDSQIIIIALTKNT